jgi:hypothetical protein
MVSGRGEMLLAEEEEEEKKKRVLVPYITDQWN